MLLFAQDGTFMDVEPNSILASAREASCFVAGYRFAAQVPKPIDDSPPKQPGEFQEPTLIKRVEPLYPEAAKRAGVQGIVRVSFTITQNGTVQDVKAIAGPGPLLSAATQAVRQWTYTPAKVDGSPASLNKEVDVEFTLPR
jgi:protein TonB